jgi:hypothetical protein
MTTQELPFCEIKGKYLTFLNPLSLLLTLRATQKLSVQNFLNGFVILKECIVGKSNSWLFHAEFQTKPIVKTVPFVKKKPSEETAKLMSEYYEVSADDDLAIAKEFEEIDAEIDNGCGT